MSSYFHKKKRSQYIGPLFVERNKNSGFFALPTVTFSSSEQVLKNFTHPLNFTFGHKIQTFN